MGDVLATLKIMPEGVDVDIEHLKEEIKGAVEGKVAGIETRPIAFGLKAIIVKVIIGDEANILERIEKRIMEIKGVGSVEAEEVTLV